MLDHGYLSLSLVVLKQTLFRHVQWIVILLQDCTLPLFALHLILLFALNSDACID